MNIIQGSKFPMSHTVSGLGKYYLTSAGVSISVTYYVSGYYDVEMIKVSKANNQLHFENSTDCNTFTAIVDTTKLPVGKIMCLFEIDYTNDDNQAVKEKFVVSSDVTITTPK